MAMVTRERLVEVARSWVGTPFLMGAQIKGAGVDCGRLLAAVYGESGFPVADDLGHWPRDWHLHRGEERYIEWIERYAHQVDAPGAGDVVMYRMGRAFSHSAIVERWPELLIHAHWRTGVGYVDGSRDAMLARRDRRFYSVF